MIFSGGKYDYMRVIIYSTIKSTTNVMSLLYDRTGYTPHHKQCVVFVSTAPLTLSLQDSGSPAQWSWCEAAG